MPRTRYTTSMANVPLPRLHGFRLLLHSLAPTTASFCAYILFGIAITVVHLVALSVDGKAYPTGLNDELLAGYANFIIQPILVFVNHTFVNSALTIVIWAIIGTIVAATLAAAANALNDWRNTKNDISISRYGNVTTHPLQSSLIIRFLWHFMLGIVIVGYTVFVLTIVRQCFSNDLLILGAASTNTVAYRFSINILLWTGLLHGYVILLRLYVQRTRLFGEILY